jgi:hypothetical protein
MPIISCVRHVLKLVRSCARHRLEHSCDPASYTRAPRSCARSGTRDPHTSRASRLTHARRCLCAHTPFVPCVLTHRDSHMRAGVHALIRHSCLAFSRIARPRLTHSHTPTSCAHELPHHAPAYHAHVLIMTHVTRMSDAHYASLRLTALVFLYARVTMSRTTSCTRLTYRSHHVSVCRQRTGPLEFACAVPSAPRASRRLLSTPLVHHMGRPTAYQRTHPLPRHHVLARTESALNILDTTVRHNAISHVPIALG